MSLHGLWNRAHSRIKGFRSNFGEWNFIKLFEICFVKHLWDYIFSLLVAIVEYRDKVDILLMDSVSLVAVCVNIIVC